MAFQPVPDVAHIVVEGRVDAQVTVNDLYFEVSGGGITPVNLQTITSAVADWVQLSLAPQLSDDWSFVRAIGTDLSVANGARIVTPLATPGGTTGEAMPNNVAACISFQTGFSGRSFRGRNYIPALPATLVTLNTIDAAWMSNVVLAYQELVGAGSFQAGWQFGVVSRVTGGALRPAGVISPVVSVGFTTPYVRSMRSREIGHGA